jgi:hypothetical protein
MPRRWLAAAFVLAGCTLGLGAGRDENQRDALFAEKRYFELRKVLESDKRDAKPETLFLRGILANAFNRLDDSIRDLTAYLESAGPNLPPARRREALSILADDYIKSFRYGKAVETREIMMPLLRAGSSAETQADVRGLTELWKAVRSFPPQSVAVSGDTEICRSYGEGVPAVFPGGEVSLLPDTGSSLSLITLTEAERLGFQLLEVPVQISTATGERVMARPSVVAEMRIGKIAVRNAVFLVVPEPMLYFAQIKTQLGGTLGFPVLAAMRELTLTRTGCIRVPGRPEVRGAPNFFLEGENLVLETKRRGRRLLFLLDTGADLSQLYPRFFRAFKDEILAHGTPATEEVEGVGTNLKAPAYLMSGLSFPVAGRKVIFDKSVPAMPAPTDINSNVFDGVFGLDILAHFETLTINFETMRIALR